MIKYNDGSVEANFVTFLSPGTFVHEETVKSIDAWNVDEAMKMAREVVERHGATPFGFRFTTMGRGPDDLDSYKLAESGTYFLGGVIETLDQVRVREPKDSVLLANMESAGYERIITNTNSWQVAVPFLDRDVLLEWSPLPDPPKEPGR